MVDCLVWPDGKTGQGREGKTRSKYPTAGEMIGKNESESVRKDEGRSCRLSMSAGTLMVSINRKYV